MEKHNVRVDVTGGGIAPAESSVLINLVRFTLGRGKGLWIAW